MRSWRTRGQLFRVRDLAGRVHQVEAHPAPAPDDLLPVPAEPAHACRRRSLAVEYPVVLLDGFGGVWESMRPRVNARWQAIRIFSVRPLSTAGSSPRPAAVEREAQRGQEGRLAAARRAHMRCSARAGPSEAPRSIPFRRR